MPLHLNSFFFSSVFHFSLRQLHCYCGLLRSFANGRPWLGEWMNYRWNPSLRLVSRSWTARRGRRWAAGAPRENWALTPTTNTPPSNVSSRSELFRWVAYDEASNRHWLTWTPCLPLLIFRFLAEKVVSWTSLSRTYSCCGLMQRSRTSFPCTHSLCGYCCYRGRHWFSTLYPYIEVVLCVFFSPSSCLIYREKESPIADNVVPPLYTYPSSTKLSQPRANSASVPFH